MTTISYSAADDDLGALDRLAEVIAPNAGPATARLIRTVASIHDIGVSDQIRSSLLATAAAIAGNPVRVVFGGHFSSGKSTVINALLGRSLLPTSDYPGGLFTEELSLEKKMSPRTASRVASNVSLGRR